MNKFVMNSNIFLNRDVPGFFHTEYYKYGLPNNPDYLNQLKNDPHHHWRDSDLQDAVNKLKSALDSDFTDIIRQVEPSQLTVCVVPRAKADSEYRSDQLLFKSTVGECARLVPGYQDGLSYIIRHTNTRTTHLRKPMEGFVNDGRTPYRGIAIDTCYFSKKIVGSDILLVDDIYTKTVNIDEDMVQALFDNGARSIVFYAVGNTVKKF